MPSVIEARSLTKTYGRLVAVNGVSFAINAGECYGFLGPNGAGKTTTVKMIHCSAPITSGDLSVFGMGVRDTPRAIKTRIGVCHQEDNLDPDFSVLKNLTVFARYFGIDVTIIRLLWVLAVCLAGTGLLAYAICWIVVPRE